MLEGIPSPGCCRASRPQGTEMGRRSRRSRQPRAAILPAKIREGKRSPGRQHPPLQPGRSSPLPAIYRRRGWGRGGRSGALRPCGRSSRPRIATPSWLAHPPPPQLLRPRVRDRRAGQRALASRLLHFLLPAAFGSFFPPVFPACTHPWSKNGGLFPPTRVAFWGRGPFLSPPHGDLARSPLAA